MKNQIRNNTTHLLSIVLLFLPNIILGQGINSISVGSHFAQAGGPSHVYNNATYHSTPYSGAGITVSFCHHLNTTLLDSARNFTKRWFWGIGGRVNYTRFGMDAFYRFPIERGFDCKVRQLNFNVTQQLSFVVSKKMMVHFAVLEEYRLNSVKGDTAVTNIYGLINDQGEPNITNFELNLELRLSFRVYRRLYLDIGYVNGLFNILKEDRDKYRALREFYPYIQLTKYF